MQLMYLIRVYIDSREIELQPGACDTITLVVEPEPYKVMHDAAAGPQLPQLQNL